MAINSTPTLAEQKMKDGSTKLKLVSPFVPGFSDKARALGGTWNATSKAWYFDTRDSRRVRDLVQTTYGADPLAEPGDEPELITVRLDLDGFETRSSNLWAFGREIVSRGNRDYSVRLGDGVIIIAGGFPGSGGSRANPALMTKPGTIVEVRDVPRPLVDKLTEARKGQQQDIERKISALHGTVAELQAQIDAYPKPFTPASAEAFKFATLERDLIYAENSLRNAQQSLTHSQESICIIESAPAPERVPAAVTQMVALAKSLTPDNRRSAIMSVLLSLDTAERKDLLAEIAKFAEQGAI